jgi:HEAT repeat protein
MRYLNPWVREQWAQDEQFGPTYHKKVADLAALRSQVHNLPVPQQEEIGRQLVARYHEEKSPLLRVEMLRTLAEFPGEGAQSAVQTALADDNPRVRMAACRALGKQTTPESLQSLATVVGSDTDVDVRMAAARELGNFKDPAAATALRTAIEDRDAALQHVAMQSLQTITGKSEYGSSVPTWRQYLDGGNPAPPPGPTVAERFRQYLNWY